MTYTYNPKGVCSRQFEFDVEDGIVKSVKIMGGCQFAPLAGENSAKAQIVRSPGHNSVWYDAATGDWYLIHHTRFKATGDRYIVQTRRMWFNDYGWPCVAPTRYVTDGRMPSDVQLRMDGAWKLLSHGQDVNTEEHISVETAFSADGAVSGGFNGEYAVEGDRITLTLDDVTYSGVCAVGYDADQDAFVSTFTAMSEDGQTLWGIRATEQE